VQNEMRISDAYPSFNDSLGDRCNDRRRCGVYGYASNANLPEPGCEYHAAGWRHDADAQWHVIGNVDGVGSRLQRRLQCKIIERAGCDRFARQHSSK
jgi:hypothetical protein